jgi:hypothetical protein
MSLSPRQARAAAKRFEKQAFAAAHRNGMVLRKLGPDRYRLVQLSPRDDNSQVPDAAAETLTLFQVLTRLMRDDVAG